MIHKIINPFMMGYFKVLQNLRQLFRVEILHGTVRCALWAGVFSHSPHIVKGHPPHTCGPTYISTGRSMNFLLMWDYNSSWCSYSSCSPCSSTHSHPHLGLKAHSPPAWMQYARHNGWLTLPLWDHILNEIGFILTLLSSLSLCVYFPKETHLCLFKDY